MKSVNKFLVITITICIAITFSGLPLQAQQPKVKNSGEIKIALEKLLTLGTVLYVAAHPDDENTAALAYFSIGRKMRAAYLALTRGGGGQNLIGKEKGALMSTVRTHELLAARRLDGSEQFFSRAVDFGYSKTAKETIKFWGKKNILEDVVFVIRKFRPDIILTRFPTDGRGGHGHHTASAILAVEGFKAAGDATKFPDQLKKYPVWQPKRVLWNTWAPYYSKPSKEEMKKYLSIDVGGFNQLLGLSYYEVASLSRSMHKSQGFGSVPRRGSRLDYYELLAGDPAKKDLMEGVDTTWNRVKGSARVKSLLEKANASFNPSKPHDIVPLLMKALKELSILPKSHWTIQKKKELQEVIRSCAGLWIEAIAEREEVSPGQTVKVKAAVINRSGYPFTLKTINVSGGNSPIQVGKTLAANTPYNQDIAMKVNRKLYSHPFWLRETPQKGIFPAANHNNKGRAISDYPFNVAVVLESDGFTVTLETPVLYRWRDPVEGEKIRWLSVTPPVTMNFEDTVFYFPTAEPRRIDMILRSGPAPVAGKMTFDLPTSWKVEPAQIDFDFKEPLKEKKISIVIKPPKKNAQCVITAKLNVGARTYTHSRLTIDYAHLPLLTLHPESHTRLVRVDLKRNGNRIGYITGSGDEIPQYLQQLGYSVTELSDDDLHHMDLSMFDTIITGIRAYNTRDILKHVGKRLKDYVAAGGRFVVQYNVARGFVSQGVKEGLIGPYNFSLSRKRVTEEDAVITLLKPDHALFNTPNKVDASDFNGWVQERGLYFAGTWDPKYTALLALNDQGEEPQKGSLLVARHGKGTFIYTGLSFFRQLPKGVSGALKLFVNLISNEDKIINVKKKETAK